MNKTTQIIIFILFIIIALFSMPKLFLTFILFNILISPIFLMIYVIAIILSGRPIPANISKITANVFKQIPNQKFIQYLGTGDNADDVPYQIVYHGTPDKRNMKKIVEEGFKAGNRNKYGTGVYFSPKIEITKEFCSDNGGGIIEICLDSTQWMAIYENIPAITVKGKIDWAIKNNIKFIYIKSEKYLLVPAESPGELVQIHGILKARALDKNGNPL